MFSKVLVPVDGSENSKSIKYSCLSVNKNRITTNCIKCDGNPSTIYLQSPKISTDQIDDYKRESETLLEKCREIANRNGIKIQTVLMEDGSAAPKIIH